MGLPIDLNKFMDFFSKDPLRATMFIMLMAIGWLYFDNKTVLTDQIKGQDARIVKLERSDSLKTVMLLECAGKK